MSEEKKEEVLISLDNLEYYQKELVKKIPKEQIWYDNVAPGNGVDENYIFAINYATGVAYYRTATGAWKMIAGGTSTETDEDIKSKVTMVRISSEAIYIPPDEKKCEISCRWMCSINGKQVNTKGEIKVIVNNNEVEAFKEAPGTITVDVREYLKEGNNSVVISVKDGYGTTKKLTFSVEVVQLVLMTSGYEQNKVIYEKNFNETNQQGIAVTVTVTGGVKKYLHMIIDGNEYIPPNKFPEFDSGRDFNTILIPPLTHGSHLVELYAEHTFENTGKTIYSNSVFYDVIWWDDDDSNNEEGVVFSSAIIASNFQTKSGKQYETFKIPYYLAKPGFETYDVRFTVIRGVKNEETGQYEYPDKDEYIIEQTSPQKKQVGTQLEWAVNSQYAGPICFRIEAMTLVEQKKENVEGENGEISEEKVYVYETETIKNFYITLEEQAKPDITRIDKLMPIEFVANQLDNESDKRDVWISYFETAATGGAGGELRANFKDFDWKSNGWELRDNRSALKIANGAKLEIPLEIFNWPRDSEKDNISFYKKGCGITIEIDVGFDEVSDAEQDFFTCYYESESENKKSGIRISPTRALITNGEKTAQVQYSNSESKKYNNSMRFTFVVNPLQDRHIPPRTEEEKKAQAAGTPITKKHDTLGSMQIYINGVGTSASEYLAQTFEHNNYPIFGSDGCSVYLHSFRMYRRSLQPDEILRNWIYDMNANDQINAYNDNWIYDLSSAEVAVDYEKLKEKIPCMIITGTLPTHKGKKEIVDIKFEGTEDGLYDFVLEGAQIDVQGTSSQYYPVKNWKFKPKNNPNFLIGPEEAGDDREKSEKYALAPDQLPAKVFCLKADYMETSSTHNTVTANIANSMYNEKTPPQNARIAKGQTQATQEEIDRAEKTRTTIYGRPIAVFYKDKPTDTTLRFGGKYNFNYDKDAEDVFGFLEEDENYESYEVIDCVEFRDNNIDMCNLIAPFSLETTLVSDLSTAQLDQYDEYSFVNNDTEVQAWGVAFEFRHHYHREEGTEHYGYLQTVADWVYYKDCRNATGNKLNIPEEERTFETGVAKFLYTNDSKIETFKDNNNNTRKVLNLVGIDKPDYKTQAYFEVKEYEVIKKEDGTEDLKERYSSIVEKESYEAIHGEQAWKDLIETEGQEDHTEKENEKEILIRIIRSYYQSLWWDSDKKKEVYIFENDTKNYRLTLFKNELPEHFNEHYCLMYFLLMELLGMIDSGTKNMFWATWGERHEKHPILNINNEEKDYNVIWYPIFYDMDSILGINNVGKMNIPYSVEFDSVFPEGAEDKGNCFNGANNAFWNNFRQAFITELNLLFAEKVADKTFSLSTILKMYEDHSEHFPVSLYNADGKLKILDKYFEGYYEASADDIANPDVKLEPKYPYWMYVYQGDRYYYRRYWLPNRFNYMLSKNFAGSYATDFISMRLWDPNRGQPEGAPHIHTDYNFEIETWKDQYTTIRYGGRAVSVKCPANKKVTIVSPSNTYNDTETGIYGASNLKSIGKMADKYATTIDLSAAVNLLEIDLGSSDPNYQNNGLNSITFGANDMLRRVNIENCKGLTSNLNLASCKNIQEINAKNSRITGVTLNENGGIIKTLILPNTTTSLILNNQPKLTTFELPPSGEIINEKEEKIDSYNLATLVVKQTPNVNTKALVEGSINTLGELEIANIDWRGENKLVDDKLLFRIKEKYENNGLFKDNISKDPPYISGICYVDSIRDFLEDELNLFFNGNISDISKLPSMNKEDLDSDAPDSVKNSNRRFKLLGQTIPTCLLKFMKNEDGNPDNDEDIFNINLDRHHIDKNQPALVVVGIIPTKNSEWDRTYDFIGWNCKKAEKDADGNIIKWDFVYTDSEKANKKLYNDDELRQTPVTTDMTFYPVFKAIPKTFTFTFTTQDGIEIEDMNDAVLKDGKVQITLISDKFVNDFGDVEKGTYEQYTSKGKAPKIKDNEEEYLDYAHRYLKWKPVNSGEKIAEDNDFKVLDVQKNAEQWKEGEQIRDFEYTVQAIDNDLDRKFRITFTDSQCEPLEGWEQKIYYSGQIISIPTLAKNKDDEFSYTFRGWRLRIDNPLNPLDPFDKEYSAYPDRVGTVEALNNLFFTYNVTLEQMPSSMIDIKLLSEKDYDENRGNELERKIFEQFTTLENNYNLIFTPIYEYTYETYTIGFYFINGGLGDNAEDYSIYKYLTTKDTDSFGEEVSRKLHWNEPIVFPDNWTPENLSIEGYHFIGFSNTENGGLVTLDAVVQGDRDYYVVAEKNEYEVTFNYYSDNDKDENSIEGKPENPTITYKYGAIVNVPVEIDSQYITYWTRHTLLDWDQDIEQIVQSDKTYNAVYGNKELRYHISFEDTLTGKELEDTVYYVDDPIEILKPEKRSLGDEDAEVDYRDDFIKWQAVTPTKNVEISPTTLTGELKFDERNVTPDFFGTDKEGNQVQKLEFKSQYKRYYKYYLTFRNSNKAIITENDITFNRIKYYADDSFNVPKASDNINKIFNTSNATQYEDYMTHSYEFLGWTYYGSNELSGKTVLSKDNYNIKIKDLFGNNNTSSAELQLIPKYKQSKKTYELKFESIPGGLPGGLTGASVEYKPISEIVKVGWKETIKPPNVTATGYTLSGDWSLSKTTETTPNPTTYVFGILDHEDKISQTYYAKWEINKYQITFNYRKTESETDKNSEGELCTISDTYDYGTKITYPTYPDIPQGYNTYWAEYSSKDKWITQDGKEFEEIVQSEREYEAQYNKKLRYYVTFKNKHTQPDGKSKEFETVTIGPLNEKSSYTVPKPIWTYGDDDSTNDYKNVFLSWETKSSNGNFEITSNEENFDDQSIDAFVFGVINGVQNQEITYTSKYNSLRKYFVSFYNSNEEEISSWTKNGPYYINDIIKTPTNNRGKIIADDDIDGQYKYTYDFKGWTYIGNSDKEGSIVLEEVNSTSSTEITIEQLFKTSPDTYILSLKPRYEYKLIPYTITFKYIKGGLPGGLSGDSITYGQTKTVTLYWGDTINPPTSPSITGYTFKNWRTAATIVENGVVTQKGSSVTFGNIKVDINTKGKTYYMDWDINKYNVTYIWYISAGEDQLWASANKKTYTYNQLNYGTIPSLPQIVIDTAFKEQTNKDYITSYRSWNYTVSGTTTEVQEQQPVVGTTTYQMNYNTPERIYTVTYVAGQKYEEVPVPFGTSYSYVDGSTYRPSWYAKYKEFTHEVGGETKYFTITSVENMGSGKLEGNKVLRATTKYLKVDNVNWSTSNVTTTIPSYGGVSYEDGVNNFSCTTVKHELGTAEYYALRGIDVNGLGIGDVLKIIATFDCKINDVGSIFGTTQAYFTILNGNDKAAVGETYDLDKADQWYTGISKTLYASDTSNIAGTSDTFGDRVRKSKKYYLGMYENISGQPTMDFININFQIYSITNQDVPNIR